MKLVKCKICSKLKPHIAKGMCNSCYKRVGTPKVKCKKCGEIKPHHAFGLCTKCYIHDNHLDYIKNWNYEKWHKIPGELYAKITKKCTVCGFTDFVEIHHLDESKKNDPNNLIGLCPNHHRMIHTEKLKPKVLELLK